MKLGLTSRSLALGTVVVMLVTFLAPPMQRYFVQRAQINALKADIEATELRITDAEKQLMRWQDPNYVKSQARGRLHYVWPGETQWIVVDKDGQQIQTKVELPVVDIASSSGSWYGRIFSSIELAAHGQPK